MVTEDRFAHLIGSLREKNYRMTPQRLTILKILAQDQGHPSAVQIYEQMRTRFPTTSLATVYKLLNVLKSVGEVQEIDFSDGDNRYDITNPIPHAHLICVQCRSITDADSQQFPALTLEVEQRYGFRVMHQRLDFFGICADCQHTASA